MNFFRILKLFYPIKFLEELIIILSLVFKNVNFRVFFLRIELINILLIFSSIERLLIDKSYEWINMIGPYKFVLGLFLIHLLFFDL